MRSPNHSLPRAFWAPLRAPSVVKHSLAICAALCCPGLLCSGPRGRREVDLPRQHHSFIRAVIPRGRGCHLSLCPHPPTPAPPHLIISACPWSSWWPHRNSFVECFRASREAVVVPSRDRVPSHRPSPSSPGRSFPHVHASGLFQSKLPGVCSARSLLLKHSCD